MRTTYESKEIVVNESKPHPHFVVALCLDNLPAVQLTNDFFKRKDFSSDFRFGGFVMVSLHPEQTNIGFVLSVRNKPDSSVEAENMHLVISLPKELVCIPGQGWKGVYLESSGYINSESVTNEVQSWEYENNNVVLPGLPWDTPHFQISQVAVNSKIYFSILIRAKNCPAEQLTFKLIPTNLPYKKAAELLNK